MRLGYDVGKYQHYILQEPSWKKIPVTKSALISIRHQGMSCWEKKKCKAARPGFAPMVFHDCFSKIDTSSVSAGTLRKQSIFVGPTSHPSILQAGLLIQFDIFLPPFFMAFLALLSSTVMHASGARSTRWVWVSSLNREHHISIDKRLGWTWSAPAVLSFSYSWSCHAYPFLFA